MENTAITMFKQTVQYENGNVWVKPVCDMFNLDVRNQHKKIKNDPILGKLVGKNTPDFDENGILVGKNNTDLGQNENLYGKTNTDLGEIDKNGRILLSKKGFVRWIQIINANTIDEPLRDKFISYQSLVFDYMFGSMEREMNMTVKVSRLRKLERLFSIIGLEIKKIKQETTLYLNERFVQTSIQWNNTKGLKQ